MPTWSNYQLDIFNWVGTSNGNLVVKAVAGSGKTSSAIQSLKYLRPDKRATMLAFNKNIAEELVQRLPVGHNASTYNSFGYGICRKAIGKSLRFDQYKTKRITESFLPKMTYGYLHYPVTRLVDLVKANVSDPTDLTQDTLMFEYGIEIQDKDKHRVYDTVRKVIQESLLQENVVDFSDQMWLPVMKGWVSDPVDFLVVDELQDTNPAQLRMIEQCIKADRIMGIGDPAQSIYAFRGADTDAMDKIQSALNAMILPLSVSYRAPLAVVSLVNQLFPHIQFEAAPNAIEGAVLEYNPRQFNESVKPGDMVLCRTNAPMVKACFSLLKQGKKATIKGRDIGQGLVALIRKMREDDIVGLWKKLEQYRVYEVDKAIAAEQFMKAQAIDDKVDTIYAIGEDCKTVSQLEDQINSLFSDNNPGITLSTVHKAKGLEAPVVYIIEPQLMPHPKAVKPKDRQQETNIEYVAKTRATQNLILVKG